MTNFKKDRFKRHTDILAFVIFNALAQKT